MTTGTVLLAQDQRSAILQATPTMDTSAYASGDLMGDKIEFAGAGLGIGAGAGSGGDGLINTIMIADLAKQSMSLDVAIWNADPSNTTFTDNAALDINDTDLFNLIGVFPVTEWFAFADNSFGQLLNIAAPFVIGEGVSTLYAALIARDAPTYGASDIKLRIGVLYG